MRDRSTHRTHGRAEQSCRKGRKLKCTVIRSTAQGSGESKDERSESRRKEERASSVQQVSDHRDCPTCRGFITAISICSNELRFSKLLDKELQLRVEQTDTPSWKTSSSQTFSYKYISKGD